MKAPLLCIALAACGGHSAPSPPPAAPPASSAAEAEPPEPDEPEPPPPVSDGSDRQPPSTASYEQAMSTPEQLDVHDDRPHLNDDQLRAPMNTLPSKCPLPANAKVTVRTAVLGGRAIGVTVEVRFEHPPPKPSTKKPAPKPKPPSKAAVQREAKAKKKLTTCIDHAVRAMTWPPSNRRDSFTSEL